MAPGLTSDISVQALPLENGKQGLKESQYPAPLKLSGALDRFAFEESTPVIGREFPSVNIVDDLLNAPNADELLRDLAITSNALVLLSTNILSLPNYTPLHRSPGIVLTQTKSHNVVSSSSGPRITSPTTCKSSLYSVWVC
jgi:hypothetical protein